MAFLSGLKAAYDSLGSEINRTFDSAKEDPLDQSKESELGAPPEDTELDARTTPQGGLNEVSIVRKTSLHLCKNS